ncbi:EthD domain-containing protein [Novosphingobium album (ex Liu et al. 2023)]|uniref:EthD domain-containing protein n=1 Tax=Novosphingobium album (ex Liu et al. 2023) TaxID=3031130 RepID=A0ABT5WLS3_9SPHN|nr:EthD domain-containing protein [Novosphingobium album (ex Liu et al. 2023)]MDE8650989.1 EthD domain-containing protein [Novosphingobium album (ex Liu et al. 2023)]
MVTIMWLLRRKPGISFEQFREHYETSHAVLGAKYLGHLLTGYRRNYVLPAETVAAGNPAMSAVLAAKGWDYDCIAEWDLRDEAAFAQVIATLSDPAIGKMFHDDEEHFLDRSSVRLVRYERHETDTSRCVPPDVPINSGSSLWDN